MQVKPYYDHTEFEALSGDVLGLDLEMANSFRSEPAVICMVGLQRYDPTLRQSCTSIATITRRSEEKDLIKWLHEQCQDFRKDHPQGKLLSFSGLENDIRWLNERLVRLDIMPPEQSEWSKLDHIDLRVEFFRRTQNSKISLKRLEEIFGIARGSTITSKKVSYILTDLVGKDKKDKVISEKLYEYLRDDVHNMFIIYNGWQHTSLGGHNLSDGEVHELLASMIRTVDKFMNNPKNRNGYKKEFPALKDYCTQLRDCMNQVLDTQSFAQFRLPAFPTVQITHSDFDRIRKKHRFLDSLEMLDAKSGDYRLKRDMFKPRGALAVVRHQGRLLMIKRADTIKRAAGYWGLPGGMVEKGETPEQCAVRELREEVNLEGQPGTILGTSPSFGGEFELTWVEIAVNDVSTLHPNLREASEVRWVEPGAVSAMEPLIPGALAHFSDFLGEEWC